LKKALIPMSIATLLAATGIPAQAQEDLVYVAVDPCRLVDTREAGGAIAADTSRNFLVSGAAGGLAGQGGNTAGCANPKAGTAPLAISAYVLAIPPDTGGTGGILSAYPSDQPAPAVGAGSTVNFSAGQVIGNTTNVTLCDPAGSCPTNGEFAILSRSTAEHVVVDVQGYFYPAAATTSCPDDMVAAGSICVDTYEASIWDAATGGSQIADDPDPALPCLDDGSDCGANAANPIYARSVTGVTPAAQITWYQAAQACANVGKRLPTTAEWQMAASGTPAGPNADTANGCNTASGGIVATGSSAASTTPCVSSWGAFDMVGNLWELAAELTDFPTGGGFTFSSTDDGFTRILGASATGTTPKSTTDIGTSNAGPLDGDNGVIGFRCVR